MGPGRWGGGREGRKRSAQATAVGIPGKGHEAIGGIQQEMGWPLPKTQMAPGRNPCEVSSGTWGGREGNRVSVAAGKRQDSETPVSGLLQVSVGCVRPWQAVGAPPGSLPLASMIPWEPQRLQAEGGIGFHARTVLQSRHFEGSDASNQKVSLQRTQGKLCRG